MTISKKECAERFAQEYGDKYFDKMYNSEKNDYDPDIKLPEPQKEVIETKKTYNKLDQDNKNQKRCQNRLSEFEKKLLKNKKDADDEKYINEKIKKQYYYSIKSFAEKYDNNSNQDDNSRVEKTIRTTLTTLFKIIGCDDITMIPKVISDDIYAIIDKFKKGKHNLNICTEKPDEILRHLNDEERMALYEFYLASKQIILLESIDKNNYDTRISKLRNDETIKKVYEMGKILKN